MDYMRKKIMKLSNVKIYCKQRFAKSANKPGLTCYGAIGCSKLLVGLLGFTQWARVMSAFAVSKTPSRKGISNSKDLYKQTSSSLQ